MTLDHDKSARGVCGDSTPRLFRVRRRPDTITEFPTRTVATERTLQRLMERHLLQLLGVNFVASEYSIGSRHAGRIDTLGLDHQESPVVIEYKRGLAVNQISQGLYYLDWLDDHRGEFYLLAREQLGTSLAQAIRWERVRLICVAAAFHRYDLRAVRQVHRRIELIRYCWFGDDLLSLTTVAACS